MARDENGRWAVVNTNLDTGESVRYMETSQDWVAKTFADKANEAFKKGGRNFESTVVSIS